MIQHPMITWREWLLTRLAPPLPLCGITLAPLLRLLRARRRDVDSPYAVRAAAAIAGSIVNSMVAWYEDKAFGAKVANAKILPPIIILGHWRTGTTHLHNLLSLDDRFACPNTYQVTYPNTFLCTEAVSARLGAFFLPPTRPMDGVRVSFRAPDEDEFATCCMTLCSPYVGLMFPGHHVEYDAFLTFRRAGTRAIDQWKAALLRFARKLTWKYGRPLVLKSPPHTCRIRLLLELFPDARFVHIRRNPHDVFLSTCHWLRTSAPWWNLQRHDQSDLEERVLRTYREMYDAFFEERPAIPAGRFHEIGFEDVERDPIAQLRRLYEALGLPDFAHVEPAVRRYLRSLQGYRKNAFAELSTALRRRIAEEWRTSFEEWGYAT